MGRTGFARSSAKKLFCLFLSMLLSVSLMGVPAWAVGASDGSEGAQADAQASVAVASETAGSAIDEARAQADAVVQAADVLEFLYVESPTVSAGATQNIAFGLADKAAVVQDAQVYLQRADDGMLLQSAASVLNGSTALFSVGFEASDTGVYAVAGIAYTVAGTAYFLDLQESDLVDAAQLLDEASAESGASVQEIVGDAQEAGAVSAAGAPVYAFQVVPAAGQSLSGASGASGAGDADGTDNAQAAPVFYAVDADGGIVAADSMQDAADAALAAAGADAGAAGAGTAGANALAAAGSLTIALDPGHGGSDPGASGGGLSENTVNLKIGQYCKAELEKYADVSVFMTRTTDEYVDLAERVERAVSAGADVFVSLHCNASGSGSGHGSEVWVPNESSYLYWETHAAGSALGGCILDELSALGLTYRGVFTKDCTDGSTYPDGSIKDYYTVIATAREYGIPGIIVEHAFIDNAGDRAFLDSETDLQALGTADATGIAEYYGLAKKETRSRLHPIMGDTQASVDQMVAKYEDSGKTYPSSVYAQYGASTIREFCETLVREAQAEGVRAEVVFEQAMHETGWLQFGGDVQPEQCNFAGLGATGGVPGNSFNDAGTGSVAKGLRAQVQHLKAYASTLDLNEECVDPRFQYVTRGCAPYVERLSGRWAANLSYGYRIANAIDALLGDAPSYTEQEIIAAGNGEEIPDEIIEDYSAIDALAAKYADSVQDGVYVIQAMKADRGAVDVENGGTAAIRANVQLYQFNATAAQKWKVTHDDTGYVSFTSLASGKMLEVCRNRASSETNVDVFDPMGTRSQKWIVHDGKIVSALDDNLVLDLANGATDSGTNIRIYVDNGTIAQQFSLIDVADYRPTRLWGSAALDTMQAVTQETYAGGSCSSIILATRDAYYDGLTAAGLAGVLDCPVLMTAASGLSDQTKSEIQRLAARGGATVYISGGTSAVSEQIEQDVKALACVNGTVRMAGDDAIGTSLETYRAGTSVQSDCWGSTCIVATDGAFYDALASGPYAFAWRAPIFLARANSSELRGSVLQAIENGGFTRVLILGGTSAVSDGIEKQLAGAGLQVKRLWGQDAFGTSVAIANFCYEEGFTANNGGIATAAAYYDSLSASALLGKLRAPLVLVWDGVNTSAVENAYGTRDGSIRNLYVFGGTAAVSDAVEATANDILLFSAF